MHTFTNSDLIELDRIWPLGQKLVVPDGGTIVVAGSYEGRYLHYLAEMFPTAKLCGYEPQQEATMKAVAGRLGPYMNRINISHSGLATARREIMLGNAGADGASAIAVSGTIVAARVLDAVQEFQRWVSIELLVLNCEAGEWALIPYLLNEMMHHRIKSMAIQFHPEYVSAERSERVLDYLGEYYINTFNCPGWSYWQRKD